MACSASLQCGLLPSMASLSSRDALSGARVAAVEGAQRSASAPQRLVVKAATGTRVLKKLKVLAIGDKSGTIRVKAETGGDSQVKLLSRVQELRLLSKAEKAGLLTLAEKFGLSLGTIEKLGLLSKAEQSGVLSAVADPSTPKLLLTISLALLVAGPAIVFVIPEDNAVEVVAQILVALLTVVGGAAAFGGSQLVGSLQEK